MNDQACDHIHTPDDGRGLRRVFIDGVEVKDVSYVDTRLGLAIVARQPLRTYPGTDCIDEDPVWGDIRVEPMEDSTVAPVRAGGDPAGVE